MSLYRNYRPKDFPSLVGQDHIKITLLNAIKSGQISHAYMFTGPRGTGKTTTARLMAKAINAEMSEDGRFDGSELAEEIDSGHLIDVIEIDAASNRGIDEMRDLREKINYSPTRAKNKVYIIDEVHMLTKEAFNALLKTLEEPPSFVYFIMATTEIHKVPETIISRCQRFDFRRITEKDLYDRLAFVCQSEGYIAEDEALKIIARQARGGLRDALSMLEQLVNGKKLDLDNVKKVLGISNFGAVEAIYGMLRDGQAAEAVTEITRIFSAGVDLIQFNKELLDYLRIEMLEKVRSGDEDSARWIIDLIANFQEAYEKQKFSYIPELPLEVAIVKSALKIRGGKAEEGRDGSKKKPEAVKGGEALEAKSGVEAQSAKRKAQNEVEVQSGVGAQRGVVGGVENGGGADDEKSEEVSIVGTDSSGSVQEVKADGAVSLQELKSRWSKVFDRIDNPLARRCLMAAHVLDLNGGSLTLGFSNNFNKDKLFVPELLALCEAAILGEFGIKVALHGKVDTSIAPMNKPTPNNVDFSANRSDEHAGLNNKVATSQSADMVSSALEIFGGEVV